MNIRLIRLFIYLLLTSAVGAQNLRPGGFWQLSSYQGDMLGQSDYQKGIFHFPAFFSNFTEVKGATLKYYRLRSNLVSTGFGFDFATMNTWKHALSETFVTAEAKSYALFWNLQLHNKHAFGGVWNKLKFFTECAPGIGLTHALTTGGITNFEMNETHVISTIVVDAWDTYAGLQETIGLDYSLNQYVGFNWSVFASQNRFLTHSITEPWFCKWGVSVGLSFYFDFDKRYYLY